MTIGRYEINSSRTFVPPTRWCSWLVSLFQSPSSASIVGQPPPQTTPGKSFSSNIQLVSHRCLGPAEQSTILHTRVSFLLFNLNLPKISFSFFPLISYFSFWNKLLTSGSLRKSESFSFEALSFYRSTPAGFYHRTNFFCPAPCWCSSSGDVPPIYRTLP